MYTERDLVRAFTGLVVASLNVTPDVRAGEVNCRACGKTLRSGDRVSAGLYCYENHSWELFGVYCPRHGVERVTDTMAVRAEEQAVVTATLEAAGYHSPDGATYPDALTLGAVDVLDHSPTADGY